MDFPIRETIEKRRSIRTYAPRPLSREDRGRLTAYAEGVENPFGVHTRIGLIETEHSEQPKKLGTYGVIKGAGSFLGIVVPQEKLGLEAAGGFHDLLFTLGAAGAGHYAWARRQMEESPVVQGNGFELCCHYLMIRLILLPSSMSSRILPSSYASMAERNSFIFSI